MNPKQSKPKQGPEEIIQDAIIKFLTLRQWFVKSTHGNMYQSGFPDLYATHYHHGPRWIEVKLPEMKGSRWTTAQLEDFPKLMCHGTRIWVLTGDTESEYQKLFKPPNLWVYMGGLY